MTISRKSARCRLAAAVLALATLTPAASQAQTAILLDPPVVAPVNQLNLTDIYINTYATSQWLFTLGMRTSDGSTVNARMTLRITPAPLRAPAKSAPRPRASPPGALPDGP